MASACVKNMPETFLDCAPVTFPAYGWLSPRTSVPEISDPFKDVGDFEFRLDDPVTMLSADELFSGGKLVPLHLSSVRSVPTTEVSPEEDEEEQPVKLPEVKKSDPVESLTSDPYLVSPKAPRCSSHWRELLGLRKLHQKATLMPNATTSSSSSNTGKSAIRQFLQRNSKSIPTSESSLNVPLLKDSDSDTLSFSSSRHSISSSSCSSHDYDDLPRLSLDADLKSYRPRVRMMKPRMVPVSEAENPKPLIDHPSAPATTINRGGRSTMRRGNQDPTAPRGLSVDSPRLSSSGKILFYGLERSSSSPSTFNGGPRYKNRGMERSYSANVRVTPVLNVPLCKSGVFGLFSSQSSQKKDGSNGNSTGSSKTHHHHHNSTGNSTRSRRESN